MIERGERFAKFPFPKIDVAFLASAMRGLMAKLIVAFAVLLANGWLKRWIQVTENLAHKRCCCKTAQRPAEEAAVSGLRRTGGRNASRLTCRPGPIGKRRPH